MPKETVWLDLTSLFHPSMSGGRLLLCLSLLLALVSCSFQAHHPAPVYSVKGQPRSAISKGSIQSATYKVKKGDTLYSIAWGADRDYQELAKLNNLDSNYTIYVGQSLRLTPLKSNVTIPSSSNYSKQNVSVVNNKIVKKQLTINNKVESKASEPQSQKSLDSAKESAYSVTTGKQVVNEIIHSPDDMMPESVSQWVWPANGKLIGAFSSQEQGNRGIKVVGNRGDIIKAAADGRVVYAGSALRGYGNLVIIKHNNDYLSAYAHADKILVKEKQQVSAGQTVATMGSSGTDQVMLHFEIRYHGQSVNPLDYLPKR